MIRKIGPKLLDAVLERIAAAAVSVAASGAMRIVKRYAERRNNPLDVTRDRKPDKLAAS